MVFIVWLVCDCRSLSQRMSASLSLSNQRRTTALIALRNPWQNLPSRVQFQRHPSHLRLHCLSIVAAEMKE